MISVGRGMISVSCATISEGRETIYVRCGIISDACCFVLCGYDFFFFLNITHFFVFKERFDVSVQINTFRKRSPEIIENFLRNVEIIVDRSRHINDGQDLEFRLIKIFSND